VTFYNSWLLPRLLDIVMQQKQILLYRERIGAAAKGRTLDVGIGSGLSLVFYGDSTTQVVGVDPSAELLVFAEERAHKVSVPVELIRASAETLPIEDESVDTVVSTFTLCSVNDPARALSEIRRVLKLGGELLFVEHGRAPDDGVARWQDRLTPLWSRVAGGCHLNRQPDDLIRSGGFEIDALETRYLKAPRAMGFIYAGNAHPV
jgi:ubiquinone/menaquinone biosynthesis C-methylase UbiE